MKLLEQQSQQSIKTITQDTNQNNLHIRKYRKRKETQHLQNKQQQKLKYKKPKRKRLYSDKKRITNNKNKVPLQEQFTQQEDRLILEQVLKIGPKFKIISAYFPSKSLSTVKNRYYKYLRYRWTSVLGKDYDSLQKENNQEILEVKELCPEIRDIVQNMINNIKSLTSQ